MGMPIFKERRRHMRRPLMGELSGHLLNADGKVVPCLAVDISNNGLRVLAREQILPGTRMILEFADTRLPLIIAWCQPEEKKKDSFACSLMAADPAHNLEEFFIKLGWLKDEDEMDSSYHPTAGIISI